jgi:hypothetical protein
MTETTQSRRRDSRRRQCRCCILFWGFAGLTCSQLPLTRSRPLTYEALPLVASARNRSINRHSNLPLPLPSDRSMSLVHINYSHLIHNQPSCLPAKRTEGKTRLLRQQVKSKQLSQIKFPIYRKLGLTLGHLAVQTRFYLIPAPSCSLFSYLNSFARCRKKTTNQDTYATSR